MSQSLIRLSEVQRRTGYSKAWLYRLMSQGNSRPPSKLAPVPLPSLKVKLMTGLTSASKTHVRRLPDSAYFYE